VCEGVKRVGRWRDMMGRRGGMKGKGVIYKRGMLYLVDVRYIFFTDTSSPSLLFKYLRE
jgi:hypothetical protein